MPLDPRGVRQVCTVCRKPFYDLNRGLGCPHCQPKPAPTKPTITIELEEETPMASMTQDERRAKVRELLSEAPRRMGELEAGTGAKAPTLRADLAAIGAVQQGNRLSPWALPETPTEAPVEKPARKKRAPVAETTPASDDVTTFSMGFLVACANELTRRISAAQDALK